MQRHSHPRLYALEQATVGRQRKKQIARGRLQLLILVGLAGLCWLVFGCVAYGPRANRKPTGLGIRDVEQPAPRYSPYTWQAL
ncbi:hypothetical protein [Hymenobacter metallilatus]|uniref:Uncharacterized protein n=1 Tax=Hymenobacter metallilatus TaxID=2493666 RepID=A0A428JLR2_9BACT|nr:hypothetical protein [Hymenobacter metallilatus]RSK33931.1 hypothetical protein EI290_09505 [Hymenobacter metallilatus]